MSEAPSPDRARNPRAAESLTFSFLQGVPESHQRAGGRWKHVAHRASETLDLALPAAPKFSAAAFAASTRAWARARSTLHARARPGTLLAEPLSRHCRVGANGCYLVASPSRSYVEERPESSDVSSNTGGVAPYRPASPVRPWGIARRTLEASKGRQDSAMLPVSAPRTGVRMYCVHWWTD